MESSELNTHTSCFSNIVVFRSRTTVSEGPGAVSEEPKVCEPIFKGPGSVLKGLIPVSETVQLVLKRPQRALNRRTLDRYHRALDSWSQRALDRVSECSTLLSDSEGPCLVSERSGTGPRGPWTWSQKALELSLRSIRSEPILKGPGLVLEGLRQVLEGLTRTGFRRSRLASEGPGPVS